MEDVLHSFGSKGKLTTIIVLLTWVAGSLDAISYLELRHVFTANMTGNTALLGLALGRGEFAAAGRSAFALLGYVCGVAAGMIIAGFRTASPGSEASEIKPLITEGAVLMLFAVMCRHVFPDPSTTAIDILIVLSGTAMGIQSAAVRRLNLPGVVTTYITGTITVLTAGLVLRLHAGGEPKAPAKAGTAIDWESRLELQAAVFFAYGLAALATAVMQQRWPMAAILSPLIAITIAVAGILPAKMRRRQA